LTDGKEHTLGYKIWRPDLLETAPHLVLDETVETSPVISVHPVDVGDSTPIGK
jgi:hypothetical protein